MTDVFVGGISQKALGATRFLSLVDLLFLLHVTCFFLRGHIWGLRL